MNLKKNFKILTAFFEQHSMDYALIGAFALHAYGFTRATRDVDFITRIEYQAEIIKFLEAKGFETLHYSDGFSNHLLSGSMIRIDLVYVSDETADVIFGSAMKLVVLDGIHVPVVSPEHLIALKLFAVFNEPARKFKEFADIKEIVRLTNIDKEVIRKYFVRYELDHYFEDVVND